MSVQIPPTETGPVVMVDDSHDDILIARRCYRRAGVKNEFLAFEGGQDLLDYLDRVDAGDAEMPALVLLDINMPDLNGFDVLSRIRAHESFRQLPVIMMLTNSDDPADVRRAKENGASGLQVKPVRVKDYVDFFAGLSE